MTHDQKIWVELSRRVVELYCPQLSKVGRITVASCREYLMLDICNHWNLDYDSLPCDQTFYHVLNKRNCGCAMKEKLAILYYARTDTAVAAEMNGVYLSIAPRERLQPTPYYNRFAAEYEKGIAAPVSVLPEPVSSFLEHLSMEEKKELYRGLQKEFGKKRK